MDCLLIYSDSYIHITLNKKKMQLILLLHVANKIYVFKFSLDIESSTQGSTLVKATRQMLANFQFGW